MILQVPDEQRLSEIFQSPRTADSVPQDGLWFYERTDETGLTLSLSFNIFERSVQVVSKLGDRTIQITTLEGASRLLDTRDYYLPDGRRMALRAEFEFKDVQGVLEIYLDPKILIQSSILRNK